MSRHLLCYLNHEKPHVIFESQQWRTPSAIVDKVCDFLGIKNFDLDACADADSSVALAFLSTETSCFDHEWQGEVSRGQYVWMNPPFGSRGVPRKRLKKMGLDPEEYAPFPGVKAFIQRAKDQAKKHGLTVAICIPTVTDAARMDLIWDATCELPLGRVAFVNLDGVTQKNPPVAHSVYIYGTVKYRGWKWGPQRYRI